jgi:hypothetical protein
LFGLVVASISEAATFFRVPGGGNLFRFQVGRRNCTTPTRWRVLGGLKGLMAPEFTASDRSCGQEDPGFLNASESAHVCRFLDSNGYCGSRPRVSEGSHAFPNDGSTLAASRDLDEFAACGKVLARILPAILQEQLNGCLQVFNAFLLCFALAIGFRKLGTERDEPFALPMDLSINRNCHAAHYSRTPHDGQDNGEGSHIAAMGAGR